MSTTSDSSRSRAVAGQAAAPTNGMPDPIIARALAWDKVDRLREEGLYAFCPTVHAIDAREALVAGKRCLHLGSNDYLGLAHDPRVVKAGSRAAERFGVGSTGSRLLNGTCPLHIELEAALAAFTDKPAALVFATGYQTNLGVITGLVGREDVVFVGRHDHASILDGGRLALGTMVRFDPSEPEQLERQLGEWKGRGRLVIVDGVHSMEGSLVDLPSLVELRRRHGFVLAVDEAHAVGVMGARGVGTSEHFGLTDQVDLVVGTFSKSLGANGGFVSGPRALIEWMRHLSRSFVFSAALSPFHAGAVLTSLAILRSEPWRLRRLHESTARLRASLQELGFDTGASESPILPVLIGGERETMFFWKALLENGVYGNPVVAPAVPDGSCRIRLSVNAAHTDEDLERVVEAFDRVRVGGAAP